MIACSPKIVITPTPTTGLPPNSPAGTSPDNPFSAALQAATQNLLHPSLKSQIGLASPAQQKFSPLNSKTSSASGDLSQLSPGAQPTGTTQVAAATNSMPVQVPPAEIPPAQVLPIHALPTHALPLPGLPVPAAPPMPASTVPQPATIGEAKLQTTTMGTEQNQSAIQTARVGAATTSTQTMPSVTTAYQQSVQVSPQLGSGTTGPTAASAAVLPGLQTTPLSSVSPGSPQVNTKEMPPNTSQQLNPQPLDGPDMLPSAAAKREAAPVQTGSPIASSTVANQPELPAHLTKPASQTVPATAQLAGNATPSANATRSVPNQPEHNGVTTESKNQTTPATGATAVAESSTPQIPLQMVVPDINAIKVSSKPADAPQAAPTLTTGQPTAVAQSAPEISNKNGDASGSGNTQSGSGNGDTSLFAPAAASAQIADDGTIPATKEGDVSASTVLVGMQAAHGAISANDASGSSAKTDAPTAEGLHSPATGASEADARIQAAATYANSLLHSARLVERLGQSELRVGIQAGEFGNVDIRTSMVRNQFTAQISVERGELGKVLASELPNLQNKLSEQRLPGANIILQNQSSGGSAGFGQGSRQNQTMPQIVIPQSSEGEPAPALMALADASISTERLDVHM